MDDFEAPREFSPTVPEYPSQHSGFRSHGNNSEYSENSSRRSYSPPAWRKAGSGWFKHQSLSPSRAGYRSKEPSPQYHDALEEDGEGDGDVTAYRIATKVPLPGSPMKGRSISNTPEPDSRPGAGEVDRGGGATGGRVNEPAQAEDMEEPSGAETPTQSNCKFMKAPVDHKHEDLVSHASHLDQEMVATFYISSKADHVCRLPLLHPPRCGAKDATD